MTGHEAIRAVLPAVGTIVGVAELLDRAHARAPHLARTTLQVAVHDLTSRSGTAAERTPLVRVGRGLYRVAAAVAR